MGCAPTRALAYPRLAIFQRDAVMFADEVELRLGAGDRRGSLLTRHLDERGLCFTLKLCRAMSRALLKFAQRPSAPRRK